MKTKNLSLPQILVLRLLRGHDCVPLGQTDESSDSEAHADSTEMLQLTLASMKEKATIQYPIIPESSLVCAKEDPPHLDSNTVGSNGLLRDMVS